MERKSGILLHISSLPSLHGIGDLGPQAYKFVDLLAKMKQSFWQILPLSPTDTAYDNSPYHSISTFANNPLFISLELLQADGLLERSELDSSPKFPDDKVDYENVTIYKKEMLSAAYERFKQKKDKYEYEQFCRFNSQWLEDFATFVAFKNNFQNAIWTDWPKEIRSRNLQSLNSLKQDVSERIELEKFMQFVFMKQWNSLKSYCNRNGIQIIGDLPIYVEHDGVECWTNPGIFKLDTQGKMLVLSGVPPDYFSETGQLWGNPVYNWEVLKKLRYDWWVKRLRHSFHLFDLTRIDHFRGLVAYWEVPVQEKTAIRGKWVPVPTDDFFAVLFQNFLKLPVIAEDLGIITDDVREAMSRYNLVGMKILLFAFGGDLSQNPYVLHNLTKNSIIYTGTHDNNTVRGWFEKEASKKEKDKLLQYLGRQVSEQEIHWELVRLAMMSVADTAIIPLQDILGLGEECRMNKPSTNQGNWRWRVTPKNLASLDVKRFKDMTEIYCRTNPLTD